jgi:hypothetical protein
MRGLHAMLASPVQCCGCHALLRTGMRAVLACEPDLEVAGEAEMARFPLPSTTLVGSAPSKQTLGEKSSPFPIRRASPRPQPSPIPRSPRSIA